MTFFKEIQYLILLECLILGLTKLNKLNTVDLWVHVTTIMGKSSFKNLGALHKDWVDADAGVEYRLICVKTERQCQMILPGPLCFIRSKVNAAIYWDGLEHFQPPSADRLYGDFFFQQESCPQHQNDLHVLFTHHVTALLNWHSRKKSIFIIFIYFSLAHLL